jgi:hypothetical protein
VFSKAPRFTEVITGALRGDGSTDLAVYVPAVLEMGAAGQTGLVLTSWASILAWAHGDGASALQGCRDDRRIDPAVLAQGVRLVDCARTGHVGILLRETERSSKELGSEGTWDLISCLAWSTRSVLGPAGGHARLLRIVDLVIPAAIAEDVPGVAGPLGLALAALSRGEHDAARTYLAVLADAATGREVLAVLLRVLATLLPVPGPLILLDEQGIPSAVVDADSGGEGDADIRLLRLAIGAIRAIQGADMRARDLVDTLSATSVDERTRLIWDLAVSAGYRLGQDNVTSNASAD